MQALVGAFLFIAEAIPARGQCEPAIELISDRTQFPTRAAHAVAFTGSSLGLVKIQAPASPLYFANYDLDFQQLTADQKVADTFVQGSIDLFWTGSEFGIFYEAFSSELILQRISAAGSPTGGAIVIPLRVGLNSGEFDVTYDATRGMYVIAHAITQTSDTGLWVTFVDPSGVVIREQRVALFVGLDTNPRVAVAGDGTVGVLYRHGIDGIQRLVRVISPTAPQQPETIIPTASGGREPFLAASDDEFAIIFRMVTATRSTLNWTRVGTDGEIVLPETQLLAAPGVDVAVVDFLWNPELAEWALAYLNSPGGFVNDPGEYRLRRFRAEDDVIDDALFSPDPLRNVFVGRNNFVWTGSGYVSPADRPLGAGVTESYLLNYCPLQGLAEADRRNAVIGAGVSFSGRASGGSAPYTFEWDFGDGTEQVGQFVQHVYTRPGVFTATLTVTDADGQKTTSTVLVSVLRPRARAVRK